MNRISRLIFPLLTVLLSCQVFAQYSADSLIKVGAVIISGNEVSREKIILRELTFKEGDRLKEQEIHAEAKRSRDNLINTGLFNFVDVQPVIQQGYVIVIIMLTERWYIWPVPVFEHAGRNLPSWLKDPDWSRINYGMYLNWNNFRGMKELLTLRAKFGYRQEFQLGYLKPDFGKNQSLGLLLSFGMVRQHEILLRTINNKPEYFSDDSRYIYEAFNPVVGFTWRPGLYFRQSVQASWTSIQFNNEQWNTAFLGSPAGQRVNFGSFYLQSEYDSRDYKYYPLTGTLLSAGILQKGIPGALQERDYKTYLLIRTYFHLQYKTWLYSSHVLKTRLTKDEELPFYFRDALGLGTYLRGYEHNMIDGNSYGIMVNNLKFAILKDRQGKIGFIPLDQFGKIHYSLFANLFFDLAYVQGKYYHLNGNTLNDKILWSTGIGFDLTSYYDQVLRLEFTLNSLGKPGIYIHNEVPFSRW